ncbi:helix-turn-helix domain-containing protein [Scandinavium goeteborgense]|uniref:helix-turn-helix domain-containing protein n=1 Tax=Scandinavium goeteborgense TaxID=1851514 RepID=UPI000F661C7E|nr:helix-turn-helix domain-containing protein [Scandinavium goeteborgense]QKN82037.1 helix-turn-helix domain-containing protein [Scandinavium goeteborgense]
MITPPERPTAAIDRLITVLKPLGKIIDVAPKKRLNWDHGGVPYVYVFLEGELSVSRVTDSILIATVTEPHIFGFSEMFSPLRGNKLRAETPCLLSRLELQDATSAIEQNGLWRDVAEVLAYHTNTMLCRDMQIVNQRTFPIVCHYLRELDKLPEETKARVNILNYIQERTGLSRSSILNIISSLKTDKYINFARGGYMLQVFDLPE